MREMLMHALHEDCVRLAIAARDWQREAAAPPEVPRASGEGGATVDFTLPGKRVAFVETRSNNSASSAQGAALHVQLPAHCTSAARVARPSPRP